MFRRALKTGYKEPFDSMMEKAAKHMDPAILDMDPHEQVFISILLEHEKDILELRNRYRTGI